MQQIKGTAPTETDAVRLRLELFNEGPVVGAAARAAQAFRQWYERQGHWVYEGRAEAVRVWREHGITGRPVHTPAAEALLAEWIAADWMPALRTDHALLQQVDTKQAPRRFSAEPQPITGFGDLA